MNVKLAKSAGFCFGVKRAVDLVYDQIGKTEGPIYTYGPIIHNEEVVRELELLSDRLHKEFIESNKGMKARVLFESSERNGMMAGYTENYIKVERPYDSSLTGRIAEIIL